MLQSYLLAVWKWRQASSGIYYFEWKTRAASAQSLTRWQQAKLEITRGDHSIVGCLHHKYGCYSTRTSRSWWIAHSMQRQPRGCNNTNSLVSYLQCERKIDTAYQYHRTCVENVATETGSPLHFWRSSKWSN